MTITMTTMTINNTNNTVYFANTGNSCNNDGHNGCFPANNNNYDQQWVNKTPTNQQKRNCYLLVVR